MGLTNKTLMEKMEELRLLFVENKVDALLIFSLPEESKMLKTIKTIAKDTGIVPSSGIAVKEIRVVETFIGNIHNKEDFENAAKFIASSIKACEVVAQAVMVEGNETNKDSKNDENGSSAAMHS